jgi:hypothetical protein
MEDNVVTFELVEFYQKYLYVYNSCCDTSKHIVLRSGISSITRQQTHSYKWITIGIIMVLLYSVLPILVPLGGIILIYQLYRSFITKMIIVSGIMKFEGNTQTYNQIHDWLITDQNYIPPQQPYPQSNLVQQTYNPV